MESDVESILARIVRLRQSVLNWAFVGRLAVQDPADEPAQVLLDRIRTERADAGPPRVAQRRRPQRHGADT
jgi:type I restriction enzyme S subunit